MRKRPITKMLRAALAEYTRAESRSLPCGERLKRLRVALKIDDRARDYAIKQAAHGTWPTRTDVDLLARLNKLSPQVKRIVRATCGYNKKR